VMLVSARVYFFFFARVIGRRAGICAASCRHNPLIWTVTVELLANPV
jgi:hypothetical protein